MHLAQNQECTIALEIIFSTLERARHALAGAVTLVCGTTRAATGDKVIVNPAAEVMLEMTAARARGFVEREVVGGVERGRDTADGGAAPAIGNEVGTAHDATRLRAGAAMRRGIEAARGCGRWFG